MAPDGPTETYLGAINHAVCGGSGCAGSGTAARPDTSITAVSVGWDPKRSSASSSGEWRWAASGPPAGRLLTMTRESRVSVWFGSGGHAHVDAFSCQPTYEGWAEGYPNPRLNSRVVEMAVERARKLTPHQDTAVHVIQPANDPRDRSRPQGGPHDYEPLPNYCCVGRFTSDFEELLVVWFTDEPPLETKWLQAQVGSVPWDKLAVAHGNDDPY